MENPIPQVQVACQIAGFLNQAIEEDTLEDELRFWANVIQGLVEHYQRDIPSSQIPVPCQVLEPPESPQAINAPTGDPPRRSKRKRQAEPDEPATKRAKKNQNTFTTRAAEYQEQGDNPQGLLGQASKWELVVSKACEDQRSRATDQAGQVSGQGLTTSQDRDVRTNIKAYFLNITRGFNIQEAAAKTVNIKDPELIKARHSLQNTIATGRTYYEIREAFGPGVFLLLPEQAIGYFQKNWSKESLKVIVHAVATVIPDTVLYCARLFDLILKPLQDGRVIPPLKVEAAKGRSGQGLLELLQPHDVITASGARPDPTAKAARPQEYMAGDPPPLSPSPPDFCPSPAPKRHGFGSQEQADPLYPLFTKKRKTAPSQAPSPRRQALQTQRAPKDPVDQGDGQSSRQYPKLEARLPLFSDDDEPDLDKPRRPQVPSSSREVPDQDDQEDGQSSRQYPVLETRLLLFSDDDESDVDKPRRPRDRGCTESK